MIVLDTHIWVWWVMGDSRLLSQHHDLIKANEQTGIGLADISLLEVAMLIARNRLTVDFTASEWLTRALAYPGMTVLPITPDIAETSTTLPPFHKDPFDRLILATAIAHGATLLTVDGEMLRYAGSAQML